MNNHPDSTTEEVKAPVVTFSNIPLDDDPPVPAFDSIPEPEDVTVVGVQFKKGGKVYFFDPGKLDIATGDEVIIDTARGAEYGFCAEGNHTVPAAKVVQPCVPSSALQRTMTAAPVRNTRTKNPMPLRSARIRFLTTSWT